MSRFARQTSPYGPGTIAKPGALEDASLAETLREYRRTVAKRYRSIELVHLERLLASGKVFVSAKLDGELWFMVKRGEDVALVAYNGRVLEGIPLTDVAKQKLAGEGDLVLAGELVAKPDAERARVGHVGRALAHPEEHTRLEFHPFDVVHGAGLPQGAPYEDRLAFLVRTFGEDGPLSPPTTLVGDVGLVSTYYREWVAGGAYEGLVVRGELGATYKLKPFFSVDAVVVAYGARMNGTDLELRELTVALRREDGSFHVLGQVGGGLSLEQRASYYARLRTMEVPSTFRLANRDGGLSRFVRPELVVEIQVSDLFETDSDDLPIARMRLDYGDAGYTPVGEAPIAGMLFPVLLRERPDKVPDVACIGLTQITSRLPLTTAYEAPALPRSEVIDRKVYAKGETAVRKVVTIATHKGRGPYPEFVVFGTDYSAGRAEPLKTSLKTAATREHADALVKEWIEENVKKGWLPYGEAPPVAAPAEKKPRAKKPKAEAGDAGA